MGDLVEESGGGFSTIGVTAVYLGVSGLVGGAERTNMEETAVISAGK